MSVNEHQTNLRWNARPNAGHVQCLLRQPADAGGTRSQVLWLPKGQRVGASVVLKGETVPWTVAEVWGEA
jgi:hypothetical protein